MVYGCGYCGTEYKTIAERMKCEQNCAARKKKLDEEARQKKLEEEKNLLREQNENYMKEIEKKRKEIVELYDKINQNLEKMGEKHPSLFEAILSMF